MDARVRGHDGQRRARVLTRRSRGSGNPSGGLRKHAGWMPACAGMTVRRRAGATASKKASHQHAGMKLFIVAKDRLSPVRAGLRLAELALDDVLIAAGWRGRIAAIARLFLSLVHLGADPLPGLHQLLGRVAHQRSVGTLHGRAHGCDLALQLVLGARRQVGRLVDELLYLEDRGVGLVAGLHFVATLLILGPMRLRFLDHAVDFVLGQAA